MFRGKKSQKIVKKLDEWQISDFLMNKDDLFLFFNFEIGPQLVCSELGTKN